MSPLPRYNCCWCNYTAKRKDKLTHHLKTKHSALSKAFSSLTSASNIQRSPASSSDLLDFVKVTIENGETCLEIPEETKGSVDKGKDKEVEGTYFNCDLCPYSTRNRNSLSSHIKAGHRPSS